MLDFPDAPAIVAGTNSYVSMDDANALAASRLFSAPWCAATDITRAQALITATALLDRLRWQGRRLAPTQPLAWPRVPDRCPAGYPISAPIPPEIVTAAVEMAIDLLRTGKMPGGAPIQQQMLGDSMVMFYPVVADDLPRHVRKLIEPHLRASSAHVAEVQF